MEKKKILLFQDYDSLLTILHTTWTELQSKKNLVVKHEKWSNEVVDDDTLFRLLNVVGHTNLELIVDTKCKEFSHYGTHHQDALNILHIGLVEEINDLFQPDQTISDHLYDAEAARVYDEVMRRFRCYNMIQATEYTMREFISPVLIGALCLTSANNAVSNKDTEVQIVAEKIINGSSGIGPVDYVMSYKSYYIVVGEAKSHNIIDGVYQNLVQQYSALETIANVKVGGIFGTERKRKLNEFVGELEFLGTYGIVSTGWKWVFTRVQKDHNGHVRAFHSAEYSITSPKPDYSETALLSIKAQIRALLQVIVHIILSQKQIVDNSPIFNQHFVSELRTADLANVPPRIHNEEEDEEDES